MRVIGGQTITVLRQSAPRDRHGDTTYAPVGTVDHVVLQWGTYDATGEFQETFDGSAVMFVPKGPVVVQPRDRITLNGNTFQVIGDRTYDERHPITGYDFGYYTVRVRTVE